ncbi:NnrS family protein [Acidovorax sp. JHL-3]|uniref:NnrS family protein n=1 Tax=Acidovorax sp. JHL-3 TaxID=1276755 RepID=UPI0004AD8E7A|nr:NnrS family protein [Acidovorax sp. JHL-3]
MKPISTPVVSTAGVAPASALQGLPFLRLGFRPFYLGAAFVACLTVPLWIASMLGWLALDLPVAPLLWHAHEMLFGFAATVIIGFLLTAVKAWTGLSTPRGALLGALALLWLAARVAAVVAPYAVYAALDMVLLPVVAGILLAVLLRARNRRNLPLMGALVLLSLANVAFHLAVMGVISLPPVQALHAGLALIVLIECVMAGRVVPAFTMSVNPGLKLQAQRPLELTTMAVTALALVSWVCAPFGVGAVTAVLAGLAALLHGVRMWRWKPWITRNRPILWILHASYAWIPVGFALLALAQLGVVAVSAAVHAFAVGVTGGLIIGMITRTARGHTGRPLQASRLEVLAYGLVMGAAVLRVLVPLAAPQWYAATLVVAALAWSTAFAIYLGLFTPWLFQTRLDGKDG